VHYVFNPDHYIGIVIANTTLSRKSIPEMKSVNKKRKTESDIRLFKDYDSTVGDEHAPCKIFYFSVHITYKYVINMFIDLPICRYSIFIVKYGHFTFGLAE
jgi:hypothetical protein